MRVTYLKSGPRRWMARPVVINFIVEAGTILWPLFQEARVSPPSVRARTPRTEDFRDSLREIDSTYLWALVLDRALFVECSCGKEATSTGSVTVVDRDADSSTGSVAVTGRDAGPSTGSVAVTGRDAGPLTGSVTVVDRDADSSTGSVTKEAESMLKGVTKEPDGP